MHWSDVQVFLAVMRDGTVRGAARVLKLDASTVSRRMAALEQSTCVRLFERTSAGLRLTSAGKVMLESSERVNEELEQMARRIVGHDRRLGGLVRVTFPGSFTALVRRAAAPFVERHPAIELELLMVDIDGRQADIAIRAAAQAPEHLVGRRVAALAGALYASQEYLVRHPEPLEDPGHTWIGWDRRLSSKPALAWLEQRFPQRCIAVRGLSTADVLYSVVAGAGVGALPCILGDGESSLVRLLDAPKEAWSGVWVLTHAEVKPAARVRAVIAHLTEAGRGERSRIEGNSARSGVQTVKAKAS